MTENLNDRSSFETISLTSSRNSNSTSNLYDTDISESDSAERKEWFENHNTHKDPICKKNCLDVCISYNNKYRDINEV